MVIETAEQAAVTAENFLAKYYPFRALEKAVKENGVWVVEFDVSVFHPKIIRIKLEASTGSVLEYQKV